MTLQRKATIISSITATILVFIKLTVGIMSGSVAVLASAIDSVLDLIISAFNYFAITKAEQPADEKFNYGKGKIEGLASVIEGTVITVSGLYILYEAVEKLFTKTPTTYLDVSLMVMGVSIVLTLALVLFLNHVANKTNNLVIKSDALHYKTDLYTNAAVLISLGLIAFTGLEFIDSLVGGAIAIYIIISAYGIIKEGVLNLLDVALEDEMVQRIKYVIAAEPDAQDYHFLKTRRSGNINFVDVHLVFTPDMLLLTAHRAADRVEENIQKLDEGSEWVINIHLDPYDDSDVHD